MSSWEVGQGPSKLSGSPLRPASLRQDRKKLPAACRYEKSNADPTAAWIWTKNLGEEDSLPRPLSMKNGGITPSRGSPAASAPVLSASAPVPVAANAASDKNGRTIHRTATIQAL